MQKENQDHSALLYEAVLALRDQEECRAFFQDRKSVV